MSKVNPMPRVRRLCAHPFKEPVYMYQLEDMTFREISLQILPYHDGFNARENMRTLGNDVCKTTDTFFNTQQQAVDHCDRILHDLSGYHFCDTFDDMPYIREKYTIMRPRPACAGDESWLLSQYSLLKSSLKLVRFIEFIITDFSYTDPCCLL